jgi:hypothetical protein
MPMNLDPLLIAFESRLERGALMRLEDAGKGGAAATDLDSLSGTVLQFQYNPETISRTRAGKWDPRLKRKGQTVRSPQAVRQRSGQGSSALLAESEQISLKITFDATEAVLAGRADAAQSGVLPQLAFLELASIGKEAVKANKQREAVQPIRPDELLLILGRERIFPVVMTSLAITEQKFLPSLVPLRAEVDLKFNVLEPTESAYSVWIGAAFGRLFERRVSAAALAAAEGDVAGAIARELNPKQGSPAQGGGAA